MVSNEERNVLKFGANIFASFMVLILLLFSTFLDPGFFGEVLLALVRLSVLKCLRDGLSVFLKIFIKSGVKKIKVTWPDF